MNHIVNPWLHKDSLHNFADAFATAERGGGTVTDVLIPEIGYTKFEDEMSKSLIVEHAKTTLWRAAVSKITGRHITLLCDNLVVVSVTGHPF